MADDGATNKFTKAALKEALVERGYVPVYMYEQTKTELIDWVRRHTFEPERVAIFKRAAEITAELAGRQAYERYGGNV